MNSHTKSILRQQVNFLSQYKHGTFSLSQLVDALSGGMKALEENLPKEFLDEWYERWGNLEELNAFEQSGENATTNPLPFANGLKDYLENYLNSGE